MHSAPSTVSWAGQTPALVFAMCASSKAPRACLCIDSSKPGSECLMRVVVYLIINREANALAMLVTALTCAARLAMLLAGPADRDQPCPVA